MTAARRPLTAGRARRLDTRASMTAQVNAAQRAGEALLPVHTRMHDDTESAAFVAHPLLRLALAHRWLARGALAMLDRLGPGLHAHIVLRARYAEAAHAAAVDAGIDQLVLLGAGFDSTALRRTPTPRSIFEVDAPTTQRAKRELLARRRIRPAHPVRWVACEFETDDFAERLRAAGFDDTRPALVIWLGVSFYLSAEAFETTVARLGRLCAVGSRLVLDYGDPQIADGSSRWPGARRMARTVARRGEPYRLGFTPDGVGAVLARHGFSVIEALRVPELITRFADPNTAWCSADDWLGIVTAERVPE